jgi:hypothetical protein
MSESAPAALKGSRLAWDTFMLHLFVSYELMIYRY